MKSVVWFLVFPALCKALHATQMLNYYGYLVIYQWKSNLVWDAEDFVLLILDQIFLRLRIKRIFPTM